MGYHQAKGMTIVATILVALVALEHLYILWIEMFAWTTKGREVFKGALPDELFERTRGLAANQGLYNGFLAAGLIWSPLEPPCTALLPPLRRDGCYLRSYALKSEHPPQARATRYPCPSSPFP